MLLRSQMSKSVSPRASLFVGLLFLGCNSARGSVAADCEPGLPTEPYEYSDALASLPSHFRSPTAGTVAFVDNMPAANPTTNAGATLGRVLFYDRQLSANGRIACASCHLQAFSFGDTARFSRGLQGTPLPRRTMALANARFYRYGFGWDEKGATLETQVLRPIDDTREMGLPLTLLERKLSATSFYPGLFAAAFGTPEITRDRIGRALAQFVRSLTSAQSRFDAVFATGGAPDSSRLTAQEWRGFRLFNGVGCVNCHRTIAQVADTANNIGLDSVSADPGAGRGHLKPSSLRNVAVRPPYMHDGRFTDLRQVVEFYSQGIQANPDLDGRLRNADGTPRRMNLASDEVDEVVAFLNTLTDSTFLVAERFSNPFSCR